MYLMLLLVVAPLVTAHDQDVFLKKLDIDKYGGTWYSVFNAPRAFGRLYSCFQETLTKTDGSTYHITASITNKMTGKRETNEGTVTLTNDTILNFLYPAAALWNAEYHVMAVDYDHYAIAGGGQSARNPSLYFIKFRSKNPDESMVTAVNEIMTKLGLNLNNFSRTCKY